MSALEKMRALQAQATARKDIGGRLLRLMDPYGVRISNLAKALGCSISTIDNIVAWGHARESTIRRILPKLEALESRLTQDVIPQEDGGYGVPDYLAKSLTLTDGTKITRCGDLTQECDWGYPARCLEVYSWRAHSRLELSVVYRYGDDKSREYDPDEIRCIRLASGRMLFPFEHESPIT